MASISSTEVPEINDFLTNGNLPYISGPHHTGAIHSVPRDIQGLTGYMSPNFARAVELEPGDL